MFSDIFDKSCLFNFFELYSEIHVMLSMIGKSDQLIDHAPK